MTAPVVAAAVRPAPSRAWAGFASVMTWAIFLQAVTAGRLMSGDGWARDAHRLGAEVLFLATLAAGVAAAVRLRAVDGGGRLALLLVGSAVALFVQHGLGTAAADGEDTLWIHVPLGVAIVGLAARTTLQARRLGTVPS